MQTTKLSVLVIGGGIGGLAAALALLRCGVAPAHGAAVPSTGWRSARQRLKVAAPRFSIACLPSWLM
jgi:cation diffusion facilitator CzcD-associated flavoprotein CzcO